MTYRRVIATPRLARHADRGPAGGSLARRWLSIALLGAVGWLSWPALAAFSQALPELKYNRDIRPILAENCFRCHGPDSAARQAELRLDQRDVAVERGAIVPGDPAASELIRRINSDDPEEQMPPPSSRRQLTAEQKETLRRWIAEGAAYEPHWSLIPPVRPELPEVHNEAWVRNPIDRFILARLEAAGLSPAPEADRRTLARRLALDLTGLPPEPEVVEAFVEDPSSDAYEKLVERLLDSPHWGEHRGRYWLDAARYADTHGIHFDNYREMWSYRDWVIRAFNRNLPFDQFTIEQLAGDLLPGATLEQIVASGFNRCNITTNEGGVIPEEYLVLYTRDRTETVSQVWLGTTANCATCHDHKFDPLSQREFYEMAAFFNNTTQGAMDGNVKDTPPVIVVPLAEDRARYTALESEIPQAQAQLDARRASARSDFESWLAAATPAAVEAHLPSDALLVLPLSEGPQQPLAARVRGEARELPAAASWEAGHVGAFALQLDGQMPIELADAGDLERDQPFTISAWLKLPGPTTGAVVARMDDGHGFTGWDLWLENGRPGMHIIHQWPANAVKVVSRQALPAGQWTHVAVSYDGSSKAAGIRVYINGRPQPTEVQADTLSESVRTDVPLKVGQRHQASRVSGAALSDVRLYGHALAAGAVEQLAAAARASWLLAKPAAERSPAEQDELYQWWLASIDTVYQELAERHAALQQEQAAIKARGTIAHVMQERPDTPTAYVLFRGEYDKRREQVHPDTPDMLPPMPPELPRNRLGFAQWLLLPEHPLTARVTVNRFWQEVFGTGLVRTAGDFGVAGELPSHPELLDWLAVEFRETGWDVKRFFRLLVTSATYRQAAITTPEKLERDPQNRLLSRGPRFRMDAEMIRDYALAASGLLVRKLGGPSVKPYQPEGVWEAVAMIGSNTRDYRRDSGEALYRRSLYTFWKRSAPPASMEIFNAPSREVCTVRRERTNTALQALVTLNDVQFVEAARYLAQRALKEAASEDAARLDFIGRRVLARPWKPAEQAVLRNSLAQLRGWYQAHPDQAAELLTVGETPADSQLDPRELAAWTMLANQVFNLDEVLNK